MFPQINFTETAGVGQSFAFNGHQSLVCRRLQLTDTDGLKTRDKTMKCEDLQLSLPLFADDDLPPGEKSNLEAHLAKCPVCRARYAEIVFLRNDLRNLSAPQIPENLVYSVRSAVAAELNQPPGKGKSIFSDDFREWLQYRLMPYGVGTFASLIFVVMFLAATLSTKNATDKINEIAALNSRPALVTTDSNSNIAYQTYNYRDLSLDLTNEEVAAERFPVAYESPSLSPKGALVALTKSLVRGKIQDDEVVVVANVFSDGLAQITEIVEAPKNRHSLEEIEKALQNDPAYAPFVPAKLDKRSDVVRVVFKIQTVNVDNEPTAKKPSRK